MFDKLPIDLKSFRTHLGANIQEMAGLMGMSVADYEDIENGAKPVSPLHVRAAMFASIIVASHSRGYGALTHEVANLVKRIGK